MSVFDLTAQNVADNSFIPLANCLAEVVKIDGDSNGNTYTYTLKHQLLFNYSILGIPPDLTPSLSGSTLTLTPVGDIGDFDNLCLLILYKKP